MFIHLDIDCYFVSAHRTLNTNLLGIPVAVGGRSNNDIFANNKIKKTISTNNISFSNKILLDDSSKSFNEYFVDKNGKIRGIITTCSYEARKFGVKKTMSVNEALQICPTLKIIPPNYTLYNKLSQELNLLLKNEIPLIEQFSIDEFFCDLTGFICEKDILEFCKYLKEKIYNELKLPVSIGIATTKYLSKLMTNYAKPNGIKYVQSKNIEDFIKNIPIENFPGIGKSTFIKLKGYNINTLGDIKNNKKIFETLNKSGIDLYNRVCGINDNVLKVQKDKKSFGITRSFDSILDRYEIRRRVMILSRYLSFVIQKENVNPLSYSLFIKYEYEIKSKESINVNILFNEIDFKKFIIKLFEKADIHKTHGIIQINITVFNFDKNNNSIYSLFEYENQQKKESLTNQIQKLRLKYGVDILKNAFEL